MTGQPITRAQDADFVLPFTPRLTPMHYQHTFLREHGEDEAWGLLWDMGTGKSKSLIDNTCLLFCRGKINGMLVIAPNGVHRNWVEEELPKHWPHDAPQPYEAWEWNTTKASGKRYLADWHTFLNNTDPAMQAAKNACWRPLGVLCMSYDGLMTDAGKQASWAFLRRRQCLYVADESQRFKEPSSKRNIRVFASAAYAPYRRIASGTPMDKPFDIYPQMRWLDPDFWKKSLGIDSYAAFKAEFGNWYKAKTAGGQTYEALDTKNPYKRLDQLAGALKTATTRITEEDADLALPPPVYKRLFHDLTTEQQRVYNELTDECMSVLNSGELITAELALVLRLRLMQVGAGFITPSAGAEPVPFSANPRADLLADGVLAALPRREPAIVWCQWQQCARVAYRVSKALGRRPVVYDAAHPEDTLEAWKRGEADDLIGNLGSGLVEGHTLVRAATMVYYSNTPRLIARHQSQKRAHRIGQTRTLTVHDLLAQGTIDEANLEAVRAKLGHVGSALGDDPERARAWLRASLRGGVPPAAESAPAQGEMDWQEYERLMEGS